MALVACGGETPDKDSSVPTDSAVQPDTNLVPTDSGTPRPDADSSVLPDTGTDTGVFTDARPDTRPDVPVDTGPADTGLVAGTCFPTSEDPDCTRRPGMRDCTCLEDTSMREACAEDPSFCRTPGTCRVGSNGCGYHLPRTIGYSPSDPFPCRDNVTNDVWSDRFQFRLFESANKQPYLVTNGVRFAPFNIWFWARDRFWQSWTDNATYTHCWAIPYPDIGMPCRSLEFRCFLPGGSETDPINNPGPYLNHMTLSWSRDFP